MQPLYAIMLGLGFWALILKSIKFIQDERFQGNFDLIDLKLDTCHFKKGNLLVFESDNQLLEVVREPKPRDGWYYNILRVITFYILFEPKPNYTVKIVTNSVTTKQ